LAINSLSGTCRRASSLQPLRTELPSTSTQPTTLTPANTQPPHCVLFRWVARELVSKIDTQTNANGKEWKTSKTNGKKLKNISKKICVAKTNLYEKIFYLKNKLLKRISRKRIFGFYTKKEKKRQGLQK